jgi:hypothetical protein
LAEGQTFAGDSDFYKRTLASYAAITPAAVRVQMQQWLRRPALTITLSPGERDAYTESKSVTAAAKPAAPKNAGAVKGDRPLPPVSENPGLQFPAIVHTKLSNGLPVEYAQRTAVPHASAAVRRSTAPVPRGGAPRARRAGSGHPSRTPRSAARGRSRATEWIGPCCRGVSWFAPFGNHVPPASCA